MWTQEEPGESTWEANKREWFESSHVIRFVVSAAARLELSKLGMNY